MNGPLENLNFMTIYKATTKILAVNFSYESLQCDFNSILIPQSVGVVMTWWLFSVFIR